jgi:hypothetical protein
MRGSDVVLHEVAIVRGSPGTDQAVAQSYLGLFSPNRATFQLRVPGDALLATPMYGDSFAGNGAAGLDVLQGDPSRVRDLQVGFGSMRVIRADATTSGPVITTELKLENGRVTGTITNRGDRPLLDPVLVLGTATVTLSSLAPGATAQVNLVVTTGNVNFMGMSDRIVGQINYSSTGMGLDEQEQRKVVRRAIIDQLTYDPMNGSSRNLSADTAMLVGWGQDAVVPLQVDGQQVRRVANVLYEIPVSIRISGQITFGSDLLTSSVVEQNSGMFSKDPWTLNFGPGTLRMAYRPIAFQGTLTPTRVSFMVTQGGEFPSLGQAAGTVLAETKRCDPAQAEPACILPMDGMPDLEFLDVRTGTWVQFAHPSMGREYELADPGRWVDPATGELNVRFVNERQDMIGFQFPVAISGTVR